MRRKTFGCVAMKDHIRARLVAERERRKDDFPSYMTFTRATTAESGWVQRFRARRYGQMSSVDSAGKPCSAGGTPSRMCGFAIPEWPLRADSGPL